MTNGVFYFALAAFYGPVATYLLTSAFYRRVNERALRRQWNELMDAEQRRRQMDRVVFEQQQAQRESKLRAELTGGKQAKGGLTERLDELERWQTSVESRLASLSRAGEDSDNNSPEAAA